MSEIIPFQPSAERQAQKHPDDADFELNLCGMTLAQAKLALNRLLAAHRFEADTTVLVRIDSAQACEGETLFQPLSRQLMEAQKNGQVCKNGVQPVIEGAGFLVRVKGHSSGDSLA
ncbi:MAG: hypothetical protein VKJ06_07370 [Vampirovibrionales bacterium]|nr:hypothetical protein [Vampirovibrionales bacterium]